MPKINLLPWREQQRAQEKKQWIFILVLVSLGTILSVFIFNQSVLHLIKNQIHRNQTLHAEINRFDIKIKAIDKVKQSRSELISKIKRIKKLQEVNVLIAHLFEELTQIIPLGIYLNRLEIKKDLIIVRGIAKSNADVASLIKNIEQSVWLQNPILIEIKNLSEKKQSVASRFKLGLRFKSLYQLG